MTAGYVLDALDEQERVAFESHLPGCPDCQAEVVALRATVAGLGAADAVAPPERLRAAVLAEVARTPQVAPEATAADAVANAEVVPLGSRRRRLVAVLAVAATLLALLAIGLGALLGQARSQRDEVSADAQRVAQVLTAPDARSTTAAVQGGGRAAVVVSPSQQAAVLVGDDLAQPPAGHVYQLWFIGADGKAASAGTFTPGPQGSAAVPLDGTPAGAATVGMTVEPSGGSSSPTTQPVLAVPLAAPSG
jgi:anti-sigma-K factor RskA